MHEDNNSLSSGCQLLNPTQAAVRLGLSPKTLANWRCLGDGPRFVKIRCGNGRGGVIRYDIREIERWVEEHTQESTSDSSAGTEQ